VPPPSAVPAFDVAACPCPDYTPAQLEASLRDLLAELGGIERFVNPGATVLLKPNLVSPRKPEDAVTTHPDLVRAMARLVREAGAGRVWVGDSPAGNHAHARLWNRTGMQAGADAGEYELVPLEPGRTRPLALGNGSTAVPVPVWYDDVDLVISLPKLKTHGLTTLSCAMKNVFGLVVGSAKALCHARYPSPRQMSSFLVDVYAGLCPGLSVVDAVVALEGEGPTNGRPIHAGLLLAGTDGVALDRVCARFLRLRPERIPMLQRAAELGLGPVHDDRIRVLGPGADLIGTVELRNSLARFFTWIPDSVFRAATRLVAWRPRIDQGDCVRCGVCADLCSQNAIVWHEDRGEFRVDPEACILCLCCAESCPYEAIRVSCPLAWPRDLRDRLLGRGRPKTPKGDDQARNAETDQRSDGDTTTPAPDREPPSKPDGYHDQ
jgi:uncharacterized protein (DUF362 family)/ferredoxin